MSGRVLCTSCQHRSHEACSGDPACDCCLESMTFGAEIEELDIDLGG